ncbi:hypothetical protein BH20ACT21_BH20ACT21_06690 [soil metagenome]
MPSLAGTLHDYAERDSARMPMLYRGCRVERFEWSMTPAKPLEQGTHILIVDDESAIVGLLVRILARSKDGSPPSSMSSTL